MINDKIQISGIENTRKKRGEMQTFKATTNERVDKNTYYIFYSL